MESREPSRFGIPLIPTNTDPDATELRFPCPKPKIPRSKIELLVKERVIGNVHLPVFSQKRPIRIDDSGRVVVKPGSATLKERGDDHHPKFTREGLKQLRRRPGDRFCEAEIFVILDLAEVHRHEKLLKTDDIRPLRCGFLDPPQSGGKIGFHVDGASVLNDTDLHERI